MKKINENTKVTLTLGQLKKLVKEGYSYWSHGDHLTGWDDMICAIEDKYSHGKKFHDMTEEEKHRAYVDFAFRQFGCNEYTMESNMVKYTEGASAKYASDLVWGSTSDWPEHLPTTEELTARFSAYARDRALKDMIKEVREDLEEHDLKSKDMDGWIDDEVKNHPALKNFINGLDLDSLKDYEKAGIARAFKDKFVDSIGAKMWKVYGGKEGIIKAFYSMGCYDALGDRTFTDRENYYTHEKIPAETSPEQLCADWDNFVSQMGFDGAPEWAMELLYQRGYYKYYAAGNTSWSNPGGRNPKRTYADLKAAMSKVSEVAENSKITLMSKDKRFELLNALEQGQHAFNTLYQEASNPSESFDEIVKYETKEIKESLAKFQQLLRSSKVEPMNEDEGDEPEKFLDDWIMPDQLTDEEFTDFTYFVDDKTGTEAYSRYEKKMPEALFNQLYAEWEKEYFK